MNQLQIISNLLIQLNEHIIQINSIILEMNNIIKRTNNNDFGKKQMEQINTLLKIISNKTDYNKTLEPCFDNIKISKNNINIKKINILFATSSQGKKENIIVNYGTSVDELIKLYLNKVKRPDLINKENNISFIYNSKSLNFGDKRKVENVFKNNNNVIFVVDKFESNFSMY